MAETLPGFEITSWQGVVLPSKTPAAIGNKLYGEIIKALQTPEVRTNSSNRASLHTPSHRPIS